MQGALDQLLEEKRHSGVVLLENNGWYQLATQPENTTIVKDFLNADLREKLTDATVEVLSIIAYRQPISKAEIESIRGVSSQYSIRHLLMRGLIEKVPNPNDARGFLYETTTEFLQHLGLTSVKDLTEFEKLVGTIKLPEAPAISSIIPDESPQNGEAAASAVLDNPENVEMDPADPAIAQAEANNIPAPQVPEEEITVVTEDIQNVEANPEPAEIIIEHPTETVTSSDEAIEEESDEDEDEDDDEDDA